jgi:hypothetical protein
LIRQKDKEIEQLETHLQETMAEYYRHDLGAIKVDLQRIL